MIEWSLRIYHYARACLGECYISWYCLIVTGRGGCLFVSGDLGRYQYWSAIFTVYYPILIQKWIGPWEAFHCLWCQSQWRDEEKF